MGFFCGIRSWIIYLYGFLYIATCDIQVASVGQPTRTIISKWTKTIHSISIVVILSAHCKAVLYILRVASSRSCLSIATNRVLWRISCTKLYAGLHCVLWSTTNWNIHRATIQECTMNVCRILNHLCVCGAHQKERGLYHVIASNHNH